ncbi:MerR family transcriptional regulator [uncultured Maritalea sp.]|uniref:MerR family transcriptional regulator n=1 Tax=uncultured Maritalea sp. TaxID=757249 RepID=UPI00261185D2|nr:MerR family transcriptional regulator [uncultured Maritalea sp.]
MRSKMYIGELAKTCNVSIDTLRYYEKIGLIKNVPRDAGGRRVYGPSFVAWLNFIKVLKATGMPLKDMLAYAAHRQTGPSSNQDRCDLLQVHELRIKQTIIEQEGCLALVQDKIAAYQSAIAKSTDIPISVCMTDHFNKRENK